MTDTAETHPDDDFSSDYQFDTLRLLSEGFCCTQIPMALALEAQGLENPALIRSLGGLCEGFPESKGVCGSLLGGICLLGYYLGKGSATEQADELIILLKSELTEWFRMQAAHRGAGRTAGNTGDTGNASESLQPLGSLVCAEITGGKEADLDVCGGLIGATYAKALQLLMEQGIDPLDPPREA